MREITFGEAIAEATIQAMEENPQVLLFGEGVDDPKGAFGTTLPVYKHFGAERVFDSPLSESAMTGIAVGAAIEGTPCIYVHLRSEFSLLGIDQIINHAAKWHYMSGGALSAPIVVRCIVGRGWGQAAQHSQSFHGMFAQMPGLKVVMPSNAYDAKGLLISAIRDPNPIVFVEHRWLHDKKGAVPDAPYAIPLGQAKVVCEGRHITCVASSLTILDALKAREVLLTEGIEMEVIDPRSIRPLDMETILRSVEKTGNLILTDISPAFGGFTAEVAARVMESDRVRLKSPLTRICPLDAPTPCSWPLEAAFYPTVEHIIDAARQKQKGPRTPSASVPRERPGENFLGPF